MQLSIFTSRCTIVQSAALRLHVVCLSVCKVGGSGSHRLEILETNCTTISPTPSLFVAQRPLHPGEHGDILGRLEVGWEKEVCWNTTAAIYLKRVKIEEKLLWRAYRKSQTLFQTVPSPTPYSLLFHKLGVRNPTQNSNLKFRANECW